jgi:hypothetical protein
MQKLSSRVGQKRAATLNLLGSGNWLKNPSSDHHWTFVPSRRRLVCTLAACRRQDRPSMDGSGVVGFRCVVD